MQELRRISSTGRWRVERIVDCDASADSSALDNGHGALHSGVMRIIADIAYAPEHGFRGLGDLYLPDDSAGAPVALAIHGGGWNAMDKHSWSGVAEFVCRDLGYAVFNINYRLLDDAPWPACGDDCLAAAHFLMAGEYEAKSQLDLSRGLLVIGGSAGGHLAMMTALRLPRELVRAVVSISGPSDLTLRLKDSPSWLERLGKFFGDGREVSEGLLTAASPMAYVKRNSPPLLCVHSVNDELIMPNQSEAIVQRYGEVGSRAEIFTFDGKDRLHGIWIEGSQPHRLLPEIEDAVTAFLKTV